jgi:hypothetical protein
MPINIQTGFADGDIFTASGGQPANIDRASLAADPAFTLRNVPAGGTTGQILAKNSNTDYDTEWINEGTVGTASDWGDLGGTITDQVDLVAYVEALVADLPIICVYNGATYETLSGNAVPTDADRVRFYCTTDDAGAPAPTYYNVHDKWFGVD